MVMFNVQEKCADKKQTTTITTVDDDGDNDGDDGYVSNGAADRLLCQ